MPFSCSIAFILKNKNVKKTARPDFSVNAVGGQCRRAGSEVGSRWKAI